MNGYAGYASRDRGGSLEPLEQGWGPTQTLERGGGRRGPRTSSAETRLPLAPAGHPGRQSVQVRPGASWRWPPRSGPSPSSSTPPQRQSRSPHNEFRQKAARSITLRSQPLQPYRRRHYDQEVPLAAVEAHRRPVPIDVRIAQSRVTFQPEARRSDDQEHQHFSGR